MITVAQERILTGYLADSMTHLPIAGGTVSNPANRKKVAADATGFFHLPVSNNDLLYAFAAHYNYDTLRYSFLFQDTITLYLSPVNIMEAVRIETGYKKYRLDSLLRRREFEEMRGNTLSMIDRSSAKPYFGLTINLDRLFKRKYRNKNKDEQNFGKVERQAYINYRFPAEMVAFYTGLKGQDLLAFMHLYTPSYEWLRGRLYKEQVIDYLSEKLTFYRSANVIHR
jgi:hypothetical protein